MAQLTIDQALQKGIEAHKAGQVQEANRIYSAILKVQPKHPDANHNMGVLAVSVGKVQEALPFLKAALEANPATTMFWLSYVDALIELGKLGDARAALGQAKRKGANGSGFDKLEKRLQAAGGASKTQNPAQDQLQALIKLHAQGQLQQALQLSELLGQQFPESYILFNIQGSVLKGLGQLDEAIYAYEKALSIKPDHATSSYNMGNALQKKGQHEEAIKAYNKAIKLNPDFVEAYNNMGNAFQAQGKLEDAVNACSKALAINPNHAQAYNSLGNALKEQGSLEEAIEAYNKALAIKPDHAEAYHNIGNVLQAQGKLEKAIEAYNKSMVIKPDSADNYNNMGNALKEQDKLEEAITAYNKAVAIKPDYAEAYNNMGNVFQKQNKLEEAIEAYNKALAIKPDYDNARCQKLYHQAKICDWHSIAKDKKLLPALGTTKECVSPFSLLALEDEPEHHRIRSEKYAATKYPRKSDRTWAKPLQKPKRLRIGYFSADFHNFPGMYLMAGLLEKHDRKKFEVSAFSYGPEKHDQMRKRIVNAVDHFIDVRAADTNTIVDLTKQRNIDIAIHRNGYTTNQRTELFASGLAPIQISYLGYPGTLGADFIDYVVADRVVIPEDMQLNYSEQIIYLPNTYQPTDNKRIISDKIITRADIGLPNHGFVFCCFNQSYKISPVEFDIWMRLLQKVEGSVLWLLKSNKWAEQNLRLQAEARGVSAERIIFAEKLPQAEHLARHRLADLFLDTFNYNAHTTASDALWAGLPVVTKTGQGFAARVAGSLLSAVGLPELVTTTEKSYEDLILGLATNPEKLAEVKRRLAINRLTKPLFNTELYTKHLENGYQKAYQNYFDGKQPQTINVSS